MNTVTFGEYNSYSDLNLILSSKTIGSPSVKASTIDLPGSDGELDFTEYFGEPKYSNRTLKFQFTAINPATAFDSTVKNLLHGQKMKIVLSDDPDVYFYGRISVGDWYVNKGISTIDVECNCEPYRMKKNETVIQTVRGVLNNYNICPHFGLWDLGSAQLVENDDTIIFTKFATVRSPMISVPELTWLTVNLGTDVTYYLGQYDSSETLLKNVKIKNLQYQFQTVKDAAYIRIALYPENVTSYPLRCSYLMVYIGQELKEYIRYNNGDALVCENSRKAVIPKVMADKPATLSYNGATVSISANSANAIPEFELHNGANKIKVVKADDGTVIKAVYREGSL